MCFTEPYDISLPHKRLTACIEEHPCPNLIGLVDYRIQSLIAQIQLVAIFSSPASDAVEITCAGWIDKDGPWDIASILLPCFLLSSSTENSRIYDEILESLLSDFRVDICPETLNKLVPVAVLISKNLVYKLALLCNGSFLLVEFINPAQDLCDCFVRILAVDIRQHCLHCQCFCILSE